MRWLLIMALCSSCFAQPRERVAMPGFIALNVASFGAATLDVALTRHCINAGTCHESNPLMQGGAGRMYAVALGLSAASTFFSYQAKKSGSRAWIIAPVANISIHGVGAGFALRW